MLYNTFFLRLLGEEVLTFYPTIFFFSVPMEWTKIERKYSRTHFQRLMQSKLSILSQKKVRYPNSFESVFHHIPGPATSPQKQKMSNTVYLRVLIHENLSGKYHIANRQNILALLLYYINHMYHSILYEILRTPIQPNLLYLAAWNSVFSPMTHTYQPLNAHRSPADFSVP